VRTLDLLSAPSVAEVRRPSQSTKPATIEGAIKSGGAAVKKMLALIPFLRVATVAQGAQLGWTKSQDEMVTMSQRPRGMRGPTPAISK
jgi:hypothetical protein